MTRTRFTFEDLENSDEWILMMLVADRQTEITNHYTPFAQRLERIHTQLWAQVMRQNELKHEVA